MRRIPIDHVIPAEQYHEVSGEEGDQEDIENSDRLQDDSFDNLDIVAQKEKEIEHLKEKYEEQEKVIVELTKNATKEPK